MKKNTFNDLLKFIEKQRWEYPFPLDRNIRMYEDLKIRGDDAVEFFEAFSVEFSVDISNFEISKYFKGEGEISFVEIFNFLKGKKRQIKYSTITIGDLENAILAGKLDETIICKK